MQNVLSVKMNTLAGLVKEPLFENNLYSGILESSRGRVKFGGKKMQWFGSEDMNISICYRHFSILESKVQWLHKIYLTC